MGGNAKRRFGCQVWQQHVSSQQLLDSQDLVLSIVVAGGAGAELYECVSKLWLMDCWGQLANKAGS